MFKDEDDLTEEELNYLHGRCDDWVRNNFQQGDIIIVETEWDYDIDAQALLHCCLFRNGMYIDVRGETSDYNDILDSFDYDEDDLKYDFNSLDEFNSFLKWLQELKDFAK